MSQDPLSMPGTNQRRRGFTFWEKVLSVVTAAVSLLAALFGLQKGQAEASARDANSELTSLETRVQQLEAENRRLTAEQDPPPSPVLPGPSPTPRPVAEPIKTSSWVASVEDGTASDLDANRTISYTSLAPPPLGVDVTYGNSGRIAPAGDTVMYQVLDATVQTCQNSKANGSNVTSVFNDELNVGDALCFLTDKNKIAIMTVTQPTRPNRNFTGLMVHVDVYSTD